MKYTTNFKFKKPEPLETRNINDINDSFDLIDAELKKQKDNNDLMLVNEVSRIEAEKQRKTNETNRQNEHTQNINQVVGIKEDYQSLRTIMLDENNAANLQNQVNTTNAQLAEKANTSSIYSKLTQKQKTYYRQNNKKLTKYTIPISFNWQDTPITILTDGINFSTTFDVENYKNVSAKTIYVDTTIGLSTNNGLTESTPVQSIEKALTLASSGDTIYLLDNEGTIYPRVKGFNGQKIEKSLNIIAKNKVIVFAGDLLTYTKTAGRNYIYQTTRTNVEKIVDLNVGDGYEYEKVASLDLCDTTRGSWYQASGDSVLYVHTLNDNSPDNKILNLLSVQITGTTCSSENVKLYLENIDFVGGTEGNFSFKNSVTYTEPIFLAKNCRFLYGKGTSSNPNALSIVGAKYCYTQNCVCAFNNSDGFNYHAQNGTKTKFIEINCIGHDNGDNSGINANNTHNGSTAHDGCVGIRINGVYYSNMGANLADVHVGTQTINLGCVCFDSKAGTKDSYDSNFSTQSSGAEAWLEGYTGFGSAWDLYAVSGTTIHSKNCDFENKQGGGIFDIS